MAIGVVVAPHGVRGTLRVRALGSGSHLREGKEPVVAGVRRRISAARQTPKGFLLDLEGVESRTDASSLRGEQLLLDRGELDAPEEGEFYVADLIGLTALTTQVRSSARWRIPSRPPPTKCSWSGLREARRTSTSLLPSNTSLRWICRTGRVVITSAGRLEVEKHRRVLRLPRAVDAALGVGVVGRAIENGIVGYRSFDLRDYSPDGRIDDMPYGGGAGMVVRVDVVARALEEVYGVPAREVKDGGGCISRSRLAGG